MIGIIDLSPGGVPKLVSKHDSSTKEGFAHNSVGSMPSLYITLRVKDPNAAIVLESISPMRIALSISANSVSRTQKKGVDGRKDLTLVFLAKHASQSDR